MGRTRHPLHRNLPRPLALVAVAEAARPVAYPKTGGHVAEVAMEEAAVAMGGVGGYHEGPQMAAAVEVARQGTQRKTSPTHRRCLTL